MQLQEHNGEQHKQSGKLCGDLYTDPDPSLTQVQKSDRTSKVIRTALDKYDVSVATNKCQLLQVLPDAGEPNAPAFTSHSINRYSLFNTPEDLLIPTGATVYYALASTPNEHSPLLRVHIPP